MTNDTYGLKYIIVEQDTLLVQFYGSWEVCDDRRPALEALK